MNTNLKSLDRMQEIERNDFKESWLKKKVNTNYRADEYEW